MADAHILALAKGGFESSESNEAAAHSTVSSCERLIFDPEADQRCQGDLEVLPPQYSRNETLWNRQGATKPAIARPARNNRNLPVRPLDDLHQHLLALFDAEMAVVPIELIA